MKEQIYFALHQLQHLSAPEEVQQKFDLIFKEDLTIWFDSRILVSDKSIHVGQWVISGRPCKPETFCLMKIESFTKAGYVKTASNMNFSPRSSDWYCGTLPLNGGRYHLFDIDKAILLIQSSREKKIDYKIQELSILLDALSPQLRKSAIFKLKELIATKDRS
jgi:hypothetical protein